jgi:hypothetical protein
VPVEISEGHRIDRAFFRPMRPAVNFNRPPHRPRQYKK